ncbi:MAG: tetratricopeptide repeat protein [Candidatus Thiodiazotropha sp. (ex Lucinoma borealis)]|nr:tetratricopeptide repeat protein [Candidatus Thiodiazotropha sp. (ex Lucinoma borealis)]
MNEVFHPHEQLVLLQQAELLIEANQLCDALVMFNRIIDQSRPASYLLQRRGWLRRLTGDLDGAIADYDRAIALSPDEADLYCSRGACLAHSMSMCPEIDRSVRLKCLEEVIDNYLASVERDPGNASAWLALVEAYLVQHDWDEAIATYAQSRPFITTEQYILVRAWLGCLAMCLAGDAINDKDKVPLHDTSIRLGRTDWCVAEIDGLLDELKSKQSMVHKFRHAMEIHQKFLGHFYENPIRSK